MPSFALDVARVTFHRLNCVQELTTTMNGNVQTSEKCFATMQQLVGDSYVRAAGAGDAVDGVASSWIVEPATSNELAQLLALCNTAGLRVLPRGGGTKLDWGNPPKGADIVLST